MASPNRETLRFAISSLPTAVTLAGTAVSGGQVLFSEQGPCVINGTVLTTLSAGVCTVSASTVGAPGAYQPVTENFVISVKAAPKKR